MDKIKSKFSLNLLTAISSIIKSNSDRITLSTDDNILVLLKDNNSNYDFFFKIEKEDIGSDGKTIVEFICKPYSSMENIAKGTRLNLNDFADHLSRWFVNIEQYKIEVLIDDAIEKEYQEEFYKDFKIVDLDAKTSRFNFSQQVLLLTYVENIEKYIIEEEIEFTLEDKEELLKEASNLKHNIATESKDSYIKKQSNFWAKVRKKSIKACEFTLKEFAKVVIKAAAEKGMTISWNTVPHYFEQLKNLLN